MNADHLFHSPAWNQTHGAAENLARTLGHRAVNPEHLALAMLLDPDTVISQIIERLADRAQIIAALREALDYPPEDSTSEGGEATAS
ncbi:Clp protease N-terminal domain-containing protein [Streptomyces sp. NPDC058740]|uniref:Clp protease N-terminal domain-containing protein n=1 Tax=Streptomyces sp. NPDC058740 TaxID=3346619 RepID=UPI0036CEB64C